MTLNDRIGVAALIAWTVEGALLIVLAIKLVAWWLTGAHPSP